MRIVRRIMLMALALAGVSAVSADVTDYVDPRIGSEGLGRVFIGPSHPYGMVKPSPDCTPDPNSGWLPMPERVDGFSQVHVSGTGGGPKYGNILIMPFADEEGMKAVTHYDTRAREDIGLGYYATTLSGSGIDVEVTTAPRTSVYRITYPADAAVRGLAVDAGFFLGESPVPDAREAQQLVGSQIEIIGDRAIRGYSRIRGGWNNGRAYTVYFYAEASEPFVRTSTWRDQTVTDSRSQVDLGTKTGALVAFPGDTREVTLRIGISFISEMKAQANCDADTRGKGFDQIREELVDAWAAILGRIQLSDRATEAQKRMFYTGLYHTMLMPVDRTGECPLWNDPVPYYDDYYAIWDTYRTSTPLITLIDPDRQRDIVNSLLIIAKRDGYMPDARSGNANGRTQGGSNAEIMIADAMAKGLDGIDYEEGLRAMLRDAEISPGGDHEAHGRGGLEEYTRLGYIPYGIPRAGNRTVEYSFDDWAIARVAEQLGHTDIAERYYMQSGNWRNLWRSDYEHDGARGFIMPRDADGVWLDSLSFGHSRHQTPKFRYTPVTFEGPWYTPWWNMFFYEASSWEYSLSVPHDVPGLIEACGGPEAMLTRLDTFFGRPYYNVNNEPSFLTPCLYHWLGRPDMTSDRVREIINENFNDTPAGLPGNDDSGAMSSFLAFHMLGLYPNAGHDYYLIHSPLIEGATINPLAGKPFTIATRNFSPRNKYIVSARLNGKDYPYSTISHADILAGGTLELTMGSRPAGWGEMKQ
ncbi:MAG: GH92 family glycosyl hydrolase [Muribaculaceae bacterium]|nr:GH92 family glycosyl hydrolase [Muribaculaceae bacterium]